ncbi:helix-turn-helix domain-containing protein [Streptomyces alkaliphilus]|uniref:Helix-turn-helix domain-containing protein n=1 Tax=Streptomyces alkaliphilus TaxID=1472722 RepID=A0A7W3TEC5_9ACTN|nr:helix-turn-helix transcriptional regulator [Streptomyces alkaliphilus]MBB0245286.1 helix-turn-helix domain-containing protein [Streptomyces alkaliphilus]
MSNTYGEWLREQRTAAGMTQQELADAAIMTRSHIAHIEAGRRIPSREDARRLDRVLDTGNVLTSFLPQKDVAVADYFEAARHLEQQATVIREFALSCVPGILQTEAYARAILRSGFAPLSDEECDRLVVTRLERAKVLAHRPLPVVWALLDEAVLRRPVGGPAVMADQLAHLVRLCEEGRVRIHVLPYELGAHPLMQGMLTLMWFEDQPPVAYSEGLQVGRVHDSPTVVERLQNAYHQALGDALPSKESLALLRATAKEHQRHA